MMEQLKKYRLVILIVLPIIILVAIRSFGGNHFKVDAIKWAEPSFNKSNMITMDQIGAIEGDKLLIYLDIDSDEIDNTGINSVFIPTDSILSKKYLKAIRKLEGSIFIRSSEIAVSSRIWMILSQMGLSNIYILADDADNEILKYKFRTDTLVKPES